MGLVGSIIVWVIGLPVALILGCFSGVGAFLLLKKYPEDRVVRERIFLSSLFVALIAIAAIILILGPAWLLLVAFFAVPLLIGNAAGIYLEVK